MKQAAAWAEVKGEAVASRSRQPVRKLSAPPVCQSAESQTESARAVVPCPSSGRATTTTTHLVWTG